MIHCISAGSRYQQRKTIFTSSQNDKSGIAINSSHTRTVRRRTVNCANTQTNVTKSLKMKQLDPSKIGKPRGVCVFPGMSVFWLFLYLVNSKKCSKSWVPFFCLRQSIHSYHLCTVRAFLYFQNRNVICIGVQPRLHWSSTCTDTDNMILTLGKLNFFGGKKIRTLFINISKE